MTGRRRANSSAPRLWGINAKGGATMARRKRTVEEQEAAAEVRAGRYTAKMRAQRAATENLKYDGVELDDERRAVLERLTVAQLKVVETWVHDAWRAGFHAGERQPSVGKPPALKLTAPQLEALRMCIDDIELKLPDVFSGVVREENTARRALGLVRDAAGLPNPATYCPRCAGCIQDGDCLCPRA